MTEWHVTPDYIADNWTDELFGLMVNKLVERKTKELDSYKKGSSREELVDEQTLFDAMGDSLKVIDGD